MKKIALLLIINTLVTFAFAQTREQAMEKRAREFHRIISLSDKAQWKKFIEENYSKTLIERPMKAKIKQQNNDDVSEEEDDIKGTVDDKVKMLERLHGDFGDSKISSLKTTGDNVEMTVNGSGPSGVFKLKFGKEKPYLIDGLGIEIRAGGN